MTVGDREITEAYSENAEFWVKIIRERLDKYQTNLVDRALLEVIGPCEGLVFLDAGCGEGYFSRKLASCGAAEVYGVDACAELVDAARALVSPASARINYLLADVAELPLADESVDLVVVNRLPHALENPGKRFHEFARVLRPGGRLVLLSLHPCFYTARADQERPPGREFSVADYFSSRMVVQHFDVAGFISPVPSVQRFFSLEEHTAMLFRAGFVITGLQEPRPTPQQLADDPWWREHFTRPLFLLFDCRLRM